jgi:hypothetical protein
MCKRWADRTTYWSTRVIFTGVVSPDEADRTARTLAAADRTPGFGYRVCINFEDESQAVVCRERIGRRGSSISPTALF